MRRALGTASRRLHRPELLAAVYRDARQVLHDEIATRALLAGILAGDVIYVDVGTNRGQILREALRVAPGARHIAFEPIPELAAELHHTLPQVDCRQLALGKEAKEARFCHFRTMDGWSGLQRSPEVSDERGDPHYITVRVSTLDAELDGVTPGLVKVDVEGAELEVLEGGRSVLTRAKPVVIFEHVAAAAALYGASSEGVWELLVELGYEIFSLTGDGPFARAAFVASAGVVNWLARPATAKSELGSARAVGSARA